MLIEIAERVDRRDGEAGRGCRLRGGARRNARDENMRHYVIPSRARAAAWEIT